MKNKIYLGLAFLCFHSFLVNGNTIENFYAPPCPDDVEIELTDLPAAIESYVSANYTDAKVDDPEQYSVNGVVTYKIELKSEDKILDDTELVFDVNGNFLGSFVEQDINPSALPEAAFTNLGAAFAGIEIEDIEMQISWTGEPIYEVDLKNGIEVILDQKGNMVCEDD